MPCVIKDNMIICSRREKPKCFYCGQPSTLLCDFRYMNGKTCDRPTCRYCAVRVGPDKDYCNMHGVTHD